MDEEIIGGSRYRRRLMIMLKLIFRFISGTFKLLLKLIGVFIVLSLIVGVKASFVITLILMSIIMLVFINNLFGVLSEGVNYPTRNKINKGYDYMEDDLWVLGMPAVTLKAYIQGFYGDD